MKLALNSTTNVATVTEDNGAEVTFNPYSSSVPWCDASYDYCPTAPRNIATLEHNTSTGAWVFTENVGEPLTFDFSSAGALTEISDVAGTI